MGIRLVLLLLIIVVPWPSINWKRPNSIRRHRRHRRSPSPSPPHCRLGSPPPWVSWSSLCVRCGNRPNVSPHSFRSFHSSFWTTRRDRNDRNGMTASRGHSSVIYVCSYLIYSSIGMKTETPKNVKSKHDREQ